MESSTILIGQMIKRIVIVEDVVSFDLYNLALGSWAELYLLLEVCLLLAPSQLNN